jgi:hypothetical protein
MEKLTKTSNGQWDLVKAEDISGQEVSSEMAMSQMESIVHHIKEISSMIESKEVMPDWVNAKITESAKALSDVAHFIAGLKKDK